MRGIETYALSPQGAESTQHGPRATDNAKYRGNQHDSANIALATAIHASVIHRLKPIDRGIKRARWDVLTGINKPAILFEGGFLTNSQDAAQIASSTHLKTLAGSIADGIVTYQNALRKWPVVKRAAARPLSSVASRSWIAACVRGVARLFCARTDS